MANGSRTGHTAEYYVHRNWLLLQVATRTSSSSGSTIPAWSRAYLSSRPRPNTDPADPARPLLHPLSLPELRQSFHDPGFRVLAMASASPAGCHLMLGPGNSYSSTQVTIIIVATLSICNAIELLVLVFTTFRRYHGLYFWSLLVASFGIIPYNIGFLLEVFSCVPLWGANLIDVYG